MYFSIKCLPTSVCTVGKCRTIGGMSSKARGESLIERWSLNSIGLFSPFESSQCGHLVWSVPSVLLPSWPRGFFLLVFVGGISALVLWLRSVLSLAWMINTNWLRVFREEFGNAASLAPHGLPERRFGHRHFPLSIFICVDRAAKWCCHQTILTGPCDLMRGHIWGRDGGTQRVVHRDPFTH